MTAEQLETVAQDIVANARGILAADESTPTIGKRFDTIDVVSSPFPVTAVTQFDGIFLGQVLGPEMLPELALIFLVPV